MGRFRAADLLVAFRGSGTPLFVAASSLAVGFWRSALGVPALVKKAPNQCGRRAEFGSQLGAVRSISSLRGPPGWVLHNSASFDRSWNHGRAVDNAAESVVETGRDE
jgi:hypothetical protein